jgi:hypothetical protein
LLSRDVEKFRQDSVQSVIEVAIVGLLQVGYRDRFRRSPQRVVGLAVIDG